MKLLTWTLALALCVLPLLHAEPQGTDQYFAGVVVETSAELLTVARVLQGKNESKEFRISAETKIEGKLERNVRVTVRYITDELGDYANLVIVRMEMKNKDKKQ